MYGAQSAANIATAQEQQRLNLLNTNGPSGSVNYAADPNAPGGYSQTTTLSPGQQGIYDQGVNAQNQALGVAGQQIGRVGDALSQGFDLSQQPALQSGIHGAPISQSLNQTPGQQTSFDTGQGVQGYLPNSGNIANGFNPGQAVQGHVANAGPIQGQVGPINFTADRNAVTDAVYQQYRDRLDPYWDQQQNSLQSRLANQGISQNNNTYGNAQQGFQRGRNDAYGQALYQAVQAGANEQNTLFGQSLAQGQFANQAQGQQYGQNANDMTQANAAAAQQYGQNLGQAQFGNQAQQQQFGQDLAGGQFANQAAGQQYVQNQGAADFANNANNTTFAQNLAGQQFGNTAQQQGFDQSLQSAAQQNAARNQGVQEQAYQQNLPLNQFNSLMSSSQVQNPQGINYSPAAVAPTDVTGAYALNAQQQQAAYQARLQQQQSNLGGLFQLGSAGLMAFSDIRLKRNIRRVGSWHGHNLYRYQYVWGPEEHQGVMAHEVAHVAGAVHSVGGYLVVNYGAL